MVSTCVDPVLHDLELLKSNFIKKSHALFYRPTLLVVEPNLHDVETLQLKFRLLKTFLLSVRKWQNNDVYLECNDKRNVSLQSLVSSTEDTVKKYAVDIHFLAKQRKSSLLRGMVSNFIESFWNLKLEITKVYTALLDCSSLQSGPCMRDDELVELVDSLVQSLADLRSRLRGASDIFLRANVELEAIEHKLIFLKNLVSFSILRGVELGQLEDLLTGIHVVSLNVACFCYTCDAKENEKYEDDAIENEKNRCSLISEQIPKIEAIDLHLIETSIKILRASKSSANLESTTKDKHIMRDFNDSLISCLWEVMRCSFVSMDSVKDQVEILYTGLKFFKNILREPQEKMDQLNEKIGALISDAGVIMCSLSVSQVKEGKANSLEVRDALDCYAMLVNTNSAIKLIKDQMSSSSTTGAVPKSSNLVLSKRKTTVTQEVVVGFDDEAKIVIDRLIGGSRQLAVVPIVGMPGLGKTTLAKKVKKDRLIKSHFHIRLWCCVSQLYDKKNLILQLLHHDDKYSDEDDLLLRLSKELKGKRYLVVFDDVWDDRFWNDLRLSFPNDENGSRILFTSRFSNVASQVEFAKDPHNLRSLTERESWILLQKKVFGDEDCPRELCILGTEIAKNCKGLPLTIVIIAGVLATIEHDGWGEVAKNLTSSIAYDTDLCKNTLQMSYENLPLYLKPCFLYFGAFQEDQEIEMRKLSWLWIAEGFVQNTESKRLEDVADDYMMDLIGRNLVMVSRENIFGVKHCRIHDLLHEFCKSRAREENFLWMLQGQDELKIFVEPLNLQRLSICSNPEHFKKSRIICSNLSSLLLFDPVERRGKLWMAEILLICRFYRHLRVLDLEAFTIDCEDFPVELNALVQLRYLAIQGPISIIPPSVANLLNLETFLVKACIFGSVLLPETVWNMKNLRHLHIWSFDGGCRFPKGTLDSVSSLHNLDTISDFKVSSRKSLEEIVKKIPNVRQLKFTMRYHSSRTARSLLLDSLNQLESLESLKVSLKFFAFSNVDNFVGDVESGFPSTLKELTLEDLHLPWSKISLVEKLPNLEVLKLLCNSFKGKRWDMKGEGLPKLRVLHLENLDVEEWTDTDCDDYYFPSLEKFQLGFMRELKKVPSCLETIPTLKTIEVMFARHNETIVSLVRRIAEVQQEYGNDSLEILIEY